MHYLRIGTLNCKGLSDEKKRRDVFNWLRQKKLDIYCLQEAHIQNSKVEQEKWECQWGYKTIFSSLDGSKCGVAVLFNNTFDSQLAILSEGI